MAQADTDYGFGFVDKRRNQGSNTSVLATPLNYTTVNTMRTRLAAVGYTTAQLDLMTRNDMVYALRVADDAAGIK